MKIDFETKDIYVFNKILRGIKYDCLNKKEQVQTSSTFLYNYFLSPYSYTIKEISSGFCNSVGIFMPISLKN